MTTNTGGDLVQAAYEDACLCAPGVTVSTAQMTRGLSRLSDLLALWATQGLKLFLLSEVSITLTAGKTTYRMMPGGDVNIARPLQVIQCTYKTSGGVVQPLQRLPRERYKRLTNQSSVQGAINSYYADRQAAWMDVSFYMTPDATAATGTVAAQVRGGAAVTTLSSDASGFPPEWYIALRWGLADELATGQPKEVQDRCATRAGAYRTALEDFDVEEETDVQFQMDSQAGYAARSFS